MQIEYNCYIPQNTEVKYDNEIKIKFFVCFMIFHSDVQDPQKCNTWGLNSKLT